MKHSLVVSWPWWLCMGLLALSPVWTKFAGATWLVLVLLGFYARWPQQPTPALPAWGEALARQWVLLCVLAFGLRAVAQLYWGDSWEKRHFDLRLLLGALAASWLLTYSPRPRVLLNPLIGALLVAASAGLVMVFLHVQFGLPTPSNRINWTLGLVFLCCLSLGMAFTENLDRIQTRLIWLSITLNMLAIFFSGTRSAYLVFPWGLVIGLYLIWKQKLFLKNFSLLRITLYALCIATILYFFNQLSEHKTTPIQRIQVATEEIKLVLTPSPEHMNGSETSVGARIVMWQHGVTLIKTSPLWGLGMKQRIEEIQGLGEKLHSSVISSLTHFHSEFINSWVEHGLWGFMSSVLYCLGLFWVAMRMLFINTASGIALLGIALNHLGASFTNLNSSHNNYGAMLSVSIVLAFYMIPTDATKQANDERANTTLT